MWKKRIFPIVLCGFCMLLLMIDPSTALSGATDGITQVLQVIIPSLFPYFFITSYLNASLLGMSIPGIQILANRLHIPKGADSILLLGFIGGYPVGAQTITNTYKEGHLTKDCARILLGYCSNAGPAFIFGVTASMFPTSYAPWCLWFLQIISTIITAHFLPKPNGQDIIWNNVSRITAIIALQRSLRSMASVCGWIILFKILIAYISKPMQALGGNALILLSGILELSNGCLSLVNIPTDSARFVLCSVFLSFGGLCVLMQTRSVAGALGLGLYLPGKLMQVAICFILSLPLSFILFQEKAMSVPWMVVGSTVSILVILCIKTICKNNCGNSSGNDI